MMGTVQARRDSAQSGMIRWSGAGEISIADEPAARWGFAAGDLVLDGPLQTLWGQAEGHAGVELSRRGENFWLRGSLGIAGEGLITPLAARDDARRLFAVRCAAAQLSHDLANRLFFLSALPELLDTVPAEELLPELQSELPLLLRFFQERVGGDLLELRAPEEIGLSELFGELMPQLHTVTRGRWTLRDERGRESIVRDRQLWRRALLGIALLTRPEQLPPLELELNWVHREAPSWDLSDRPIPAGAGWQLSLPLSISSEALELWRGARPYLSPQEGRLDWMTSTLSICATLAERERAGFFYQGERLSLWCPQSELPLSPLAPVNRI